MATPHGRGPVLVNVGWEAAAASGHRRHLVAEMPAPDGSTGYPEPLGLDLPLTPDPVVILPLTSPPVEGEDGFSAQFKGKGDWSGGGKGKGRGGKGPKGPHPPAPLLVRPECGFSGILVNAKTRFPVPNALFAGSPSLQERRSRVQAVVQAGSMAVVQAGQVNPPRGGGPMLEPSSEEWWDEWGNEVWPKKKNKASQNDRRKKKIKIEKFWAAQQGIANPIIHIVLKKKRKKPKWERALAREAREELPSVSLAASSRPPLARRRVGGGEVAPTIGMHVGLDSRREISSPLRSKSRSRSRSSLSSMSKMLRAGQARNRSPRSSSPLNEEMVEELEEMLEVEETGYEDFAGSAGLADETGLADEEAEETSSTAEEEELPPIVSQEPGGAPKGDGGGGHVSLSTEDEDEGEDEDEEEESDDSEEKNAAAAARAPEEAGCGGGGCGGSSEEMKDLLRSKLRLSELRLSKGTPKGGGGSSGLVGQGAPPSGIEMVAAENEEMEVEVAAENEEVELEEKGLEGDPSPDLGAVESGPPAVEAPPAPTKPSYGDLKLKIDRLKALGDPTIPGPGLPLMLPVEGHGMCLYNGQLVGCHGSFTDALYMLRTVGPSGTTVIGPMCNHCRLRADEADVMIRSVRPDRAPLDWLPVA